MEAIGFILTASLKWSGDKWAYLIVTAILECPKIF